MAERRSKELSDAPPPTLSVCVPTRNGVRWIDETLRSILAQDYPDLEVIVGDDASTDGTPDHAASFGDPRIQVYRFAERAGLGANWNRTLQLARGEFVALVCQDDLVAPQWASKLVGLLERHPEADLAFCRRSFRFEDDTSRTLLSGFFEHRYPDILQPFYSRIGEVVSQEVMVEEAFRHLFEINLIGEPSFVIVRRTAHPVRQGFNASLGQMIDWEFFTRFFSERPVLHCPEVLGEFRLHADGCSVTNSSLSLHCREYEFLLDVVHQRFSHYLTDDQHAALKERRAEVRRLWWEHKLSENRERFAYASRTRAGVDAAAGSGPAAETDAAIASQQPLMILGMHRSGTSLAASLLESAGLDIGDRLMAGNWSNPRGHFEDMDFVHFQQLALVRLGLHPDGWLATGLPDLPEEYMAMARALVDRKRRSARPWGWKDPRTVLFLRHWLSIVPAAKFAIVYRAPWEVVESLYLRGDAVFAGDPEFALRIWLYYNRTLLDLAVAAPERCVLANVETIAADPVAWVAAIAERSGLTLHAPKAGIYDRDLLHSEQARDRAGIIFRHYPEVVELFAELETYAFRPPGIEAHALWSRGSTAEAERRLALSDWQRLCAHRRIAST